MVSFANKKLLERHYEYFQQKHCYAMRIKILHSSPFATHPKTQRIFVMRRAIYPGTFDPVTNGHMDIIRRACNMFDEIVVAVADSKSKKPMFALEQRKKMLEAATASFPHVRVVGFYSLLVDLSSELESNIVIRGLRAVSDFEYELQMGYANASLKKDLETIYLMPSLEHAFVSSSVVRTILEFDGKIDHLVDASTLNLIRKYRSK
jgi:pantetheine-phosphate adenylyltransferase